jgi:hypothetical protein
MDITQIRKANLFSLIAGFRTQAEFADAVDTSTAYLSQLKKGTRANGRPVVVGNDLARQIEEKLKLAHGWMDKIHTKPMTQPELELGLEPMLVAQVTDMNRPKDVIQPNPELLLAYEQGRAEVLKLVCTILIQNDPTYAETVLTALSASRLAADGVTNHVKNAPSLEKNYAQTVLEAWTNTSKELLEHAQALKIAQ